MIEYGRTTKARKFTPSELTKILRKFVGTEDIKLKTHRDKNVDKNQVIITGHYDSWEDEANYASIVIYANFNPDQGVIFMKNIDWHRLCVDLVECTGHEIIHQAQYRARDFDIGEKIFVSGSKDAGRRLAQEYLGNPDEIEAYGYSIAAEIYLTIAPKRLNSKHVSKIALYKEYVETFGIQHPVVRELLVYVVKYYSQLNGEEAHVYKQQQEQ
jgi:hypothetical protein